MILVIPCTGYVRIILCTKYKYKKVPKALQKKITKIRKAGVFFGIYGSQNTMGSMYF